MQERLIRSTMTTLGLLNRGRFVERCDEHLTEAIAALEALPDGKGTATVTITLKVVQDGDRQTISPSVKSKLPEEKDFPGTVFWVVDGALSLQHPSQIDMFPRDAASNGDAVGDGIRRPRDVS